MMSQIMFGKGQVKICFDEKMGYLEYIKYMERLIPLHSRIWSIQTKTGEIGIADMVQFRFERYGNMLKLFWESDVALVTVTVREDRSGKIRWNINVDLYESNAVKEVKFPILEGMKFASENYLLITWQNGEIIRNPIDSLLCKGETIPFWMGRGKGAYENDYPAGLSYQYCSFYSPSEYGYYLATEDENACIKSYTYQYCEQLHAMDFVITNYPENMGKTSNYCMPYDFVLLMFKGDWQTATQIYRAWATQQKWCKKRLFEKHLPEKVVKTDLWRINHTNGALGTRTQEYFDTSLMLRDALDCNLALHWYGWNLNEEHDWDTPDYFDEEKRAMGWPQQLKQWNKRFSEEGIVKIPYTNARLWERTTKSWEQLNIAAAAIKGEDGEIFNEPWTPEQHLTTICPSSAVWQNKVMDMCREFVVEEDFDGVYLDQVASFNAMLCFDEKHPHPQGGGAWWNDAYHRMLSNVRALLGDESIMTTESCCETYIDIFDLFLVLDTNFQHTGLNAVMGSGDAESVPLFSMIYGDYALSYGSICRFTDRLDRFEFNFIRNILWGAIPSVEAGDMSQIKSGQAYLDVLKKGVDFYKTHKNVFLYGRLCEIPQYICAECEMDWTGKQQGKASGMYTYVNTFPAVYATIWESMEGQSYLIAYNFSNCVQEMELATRKYEIPAKSFYFDIF